MKIIDVQQGSPEWLAHRIMVRNASDAPIMKGASKKATRNELIRLMATGLEREYSDWVKNVLFARGHDVEAAARYIADGIVGDDLFPIVATDDDGYLGASFDGLTMDGRVAWECKQWNEEKAATVRAGKVPEEDFWQVAQQLVVSDAERLLYMVTDGTPERTVHCWVDPPNLRQVRELMAAWKQFDQDVAEYVPEAPAPVVVAQATEALPAVAVKLDGALDVTSNLDLFGDRLKAFIDGIKQKPDTDQEFADCEAAVKVLKRAEEALEAAETSALAQINPVEELRRTVENYRGQARTARLLLEKVVKNRKDEIRIEIGQKAQRAFMDHVNKLNARLGRVKVLVSVPDFAAAMKGKKTIDGLRSAVDNLLAQSKIDSSARAEDMATNLATIDELAKDHQFLVRDVQDLAEANPEHVAGIVRGRIAEHEEKERQRQDAERERIRKEEAERADKEAAAKVEAAREQIRDEERTKAREEVAEQPMSPAPAAQPAPGLSAPSAPAAAPSTAVPAKPLGRAAWPARQPVSTPKRPTDAEIIQHLSNHYGVSWETVTEWLACIDLSIDAGVTA